MTPEKEAAAVMLSKRRFDRSAMDAYCKRRGAELLRVLQEAHGAPNACSGVCLAIDSDGIVKIFKEMLPHKDNVLQPCEPEGKIHSLANGVSGLPRLYGTEEFDGICVLRQSVAYGQELQAWVDSREGMSAAQVRSVVGRLASVLVELHHKGVLHQDIRPQNAKVDGDEASLIDVGDGRIIPAYRAEIPATVGDAYYAAPETKARNVASTSSDVWQLGAVARELRRAEYGDEVLNDMIARMLACEPGKRPSAAEVAFTLRTAPARIPHPPGKRRTRMQEGTVLFPARMGIPHRGHVDYMARVMELGFPLCISLQRSFSITDRDPYPKWKVMKMVAQSLIDKGFLPDEDFRFVFTPVIGSNEAHRRHFEEMPGWERVVAVASGNPDVHRLFEDMAIIDQRAVFGREGEPFEVRSWGEELRAAIRNGDRMRFERLAASGVERIMSLEELHVQYAQAPVERDGGTVTVALVAKDGEPIMSGLRGPYESPYDTVVRLLDESRLYRVARRNPYGRDATILLDRQLRLLQDRPTVVDGDGNVTVVLALI